MELSYLLLEGEVGAEAIAGKVGQDLKGKSLSFGKVA